MPSLPLRHGRAGAGLSTVHPSCSSVPETGSGAPLAPGSCSVRLGQDMPGGNEGKQQRGSLLS